MIGGSFRKLGWLWSMFLVLTTCIFLSNMCDAAVTIKVLMRGGINPDPTNQVIAKFEEKNPGIKVVVQYEPYNEIDNKFLTMLAGGQPPDIIAAASVYGWARYAYDGLFIDLGPYVKRDKQEINFDDFWPAGWKSATIAGKLRSMPTSVRMGSATMYNATLFEESGLALPPTDWEDKSWNWDRMVQYAKKLTKVRSDGKATQFGVDFWDDDNIIQHSWAFGGDWFDNLSYEKGIINQVTLYTPQNVRAYQAVADLRIKHMIRPGGPVSAAAPIGGVQSFSLDGKLAMWIDPGFLPSTKDFRWGIAPFPYPEGGPRDRAFAWFEAMAIVSGSKHVEEAWKFIKYLASDEARFVDKNPDSLTRGQHLLWLGYGGISYGPRKSFWTEYINQWLKLGVSAIPANQVFEVVTGALQRSVALPRCTIVGANEVWQNAVKKELPVALYGRAPVETALRNAQRIAEEAVKNFKAQMGK